MSNAGQSHFHVEVVAAGLMETDVPPHVTTTVATFESRHTSPATIAPLDCMANIALMWVGLGSLKPSEP